MTPGRHAAGDDAVVEVLEQPREYRHSSERQVWPERYELESGFRGGPIIAFQISDAVLDAATGAIYDRTGALIREAFGTRQVMERFIARQPGPPADVPRSDAPIIALGTTRMANYCRWWLDSMAIPFVLSKTSLARPDALGVLYQANAPFQLAALPFLDKTLLLQDEADRFVRGDILRSPGVTYNGGQRLGRIVASMGDYFLKRAGLKRRRDDGRRIYISRRSTRIRRVINEEPFAAQLEAMGFETVELEHLSLTEQMALFASAGVIVSPHGAGLTNLLWSSAGAKLIEIFPDGGLHGSAFMRIATQMGVDYRAVVGAAGQNRDRKDNPNNADIEIDLAPTIALIKDALG